MRLALVLKHIQFCVDMPTSSTKVSDFYIDNDNASSSTSLIFPIKYWGNNSAASSQTSDNYDITVNVILSSNLIFPVRLKQPIHLMVSAAQPKWVMNPTIVEITEGIHIDLDIGSILNISSDSTLTWFYVDRITGVGSHPPNTQIPKISAESNPLANGQSTKIKLNGQVNYVIGG